MNRFYRFAVVFVGAIVSLFYPVKTEGLEHLPTGGVLVCANHSSNWDPLLLAMAFTKRHHLHFMAKIELMRIPVLGRILTGLGVFGVQRGHSDLTAIRQAIHYLKNGEIVMLFPQGGRFREEENAEAKTGAALLALRTGVPMLPVYIEAKKRLFRRNRVIIGEPYRPEAASRKGSGEIYRAVADNLMHQITALGETQ